MQLQDMKLNCEWLKGGSQPIELKNLFVFNAFTFLNF